MKKRFLLLFLALFVACASADAFAGYEFHLDYANDFHGSGGEFRVTPSGDAWANSGFAFKGYSEWTGAYNADGTLKSFVTFCVERSQDVALDQNNDYDQIGPDVRPEGDALSKGTAFLYEAFAMGALEGYDYENANGQRKADAKALQDVFWYLEDEQGPKSYSLFGYYLGLATDKFGSLAVAKSDYDGGTVHVLSDREQQDLLVMTGQDPTPAPEPATIVTFSMLGCLGAYSLHRRRRRNA